MAQTTISGNCMIEEDDIDYPEELIAEQIKHLDFSALKTSDKKPVITSKTTTNSAADLLKPKKELRPSICKTNLERFQFLCKDLPSPKLFIDFDFYFSIAACLSRKVWIGKGTHKLYANQFMICVADPGIGKSLPARTVSKLLESLVETKQTKINGTEVLNEVPLLNLAPDAITFEKLVLRAAAATDSCFSSEELIKQGFPKIYQHASTTFCLADELGMLFTENTKRVVSFLMKAWDCDKFEGDTIKHGVVKIQNLCVNLLGCTTPEIMKDLTKTKVFDSGFIGRVIFLYGAKKFQNVARIIETAEQLNEQEHLRKYLRTLAKIQPMEITYTPEAEAWMDDWNLNQSDDKLNNHWRLKDYYARKVVHIPKLAMAIHFAEKITPVIEVEDLLQAKLLLERAEVDMHKSLAAGGENLQATVMEEIRSYLEANGPTTKKKLRLQFFTSLDEESLAKVFDFMLNSEIACNCTIDGKPALQLKKESE